MHFLPAASARRPSCTGPSAPKTRIRMARRRKRFLVTF